MPDNTVKELYFIDMDGVLARYDYNAYDKNKGRKPGIAIYEDPDLHYFRNLKPDPIAINITKNLLKKLCVAYFPYTACRSARGIFLFCSLHFAFYLL